MIHSKLGSNILRKSTGHHLWLNQRCIGTLNCVLHSNSTLQHNSNVNKLNEQNVQIKSHRNVPLNGLINSRRFLHYYLKNNSCSNSINNNVSKSKLLPVIYRDQPKSLSTKPMGTSEQLLFKKINTEGNLNLVESTTPFELLAPSAYVPYIELCRLNKFTGNMFLIYPCLWGVALGSERGELVNFQTMFLFILGAVLMRSAGCIVNDLMDKNYDRQVERTKNRPLAAGRLSNYEAIAAMAACLTGSLHILLSFDCLTIMYGASSLLLVTIYPLMKRITNWPQLFLGFTFNWGVILGYSALQNGIIDWQTVLPMYMAGIFWTLIYDTIYAYQDYHYDKKLGLKSTTMVFGDKPKVWLNCFAAAMTSSLLAAGYISNQLYPFYLGTGIAALHTAMIIRKLDVKNPENCFKQFRYSQFIGYYILMGIILSVLFDRPKKSKKKIEIDFKDEHAII